MIGKKVHILNKRFKNYCIKHLIKKELQFFQKLLL